ncbi:hypothetical protein [Rossellomorea aquimaris]|uniref:hypothetical protein n=1 Tax=Rossellomorea aquimaris TaxID=189382 RepID=UPI001CFE1478|nr:hypothetical protein [Rossellomorea aquimaris]
MFKQHYSVSVHIYTIDLLIRFTIHCTFRETFNNHAEMEHNHAGYERFMRLSA